MIAVSFETTTWENRGRPRSYWLESMFCTQHTMIEVMNHIKVYKVLLKSTGRSEYFLSQDDECVTAMNSIPPGEVMHGPGSHCRSI